MLRARLYRLLRPMTETSPGLRLTVRNFRGVREASWAPEGVCALVGPNASGKSTLLEAFLFMHYAARRSPKDAIAVTGGGQGFLSHVPVLEAPGDDPALARVRLTAETESASWTLSFAATNDNIAPKYDEELRGAGMNQRSAVDIDHPSLLQHHFLWNFGEKPGEEVRSAVELAQRLYNLSLYRPWELQQFRRKTSDPTLDDVRLNPDGGNIFVVLQNWRDTREHGWRYQWVVEQLRRIHGRSVSGVEFIKGIGGLSMSFYAPGDEVPLPIKAASNGVLGTLLALTAVAGAKEHGLVLLDEPDNGLHPAAIRALVEAFRARYEERGINVVMATHSPVILNAFNDAPEDVWVTERKPGAVFPLRLTELCDPEWLANFRLGNIYGTGFGRQDPLSGSGE
jgi:predicted ATPase